MTTCLISGLINNGFAKENVIISDINSKALKLLSEQFSIQTTLNNVAAARQADIVLLAVKPQVMQTVCEQLANIEQNNTRLFISIAAGVRAVDIDHWLGGSRNVVRSMPNTPAFIRYGATGLYANPRVNCEQKQLAQSILDAVGISVWVETETQLDAVTAISGSGPAYFFYFIELLQRAGEKLGLDSKTSLKLAQQTALGASKMAQQNDIVDLRTRVTSKNGTTEQAILAFQNNQFGTLVEIATKAAYDRSVALAKELSNQTCPD